MSRLCALSRSHSARAFSSLSKQRKAPLRMTGLEAGPKMLAGFRCVHTLKKRMLMRAPLSAKTRDHAKRFQEVAGFGFLTARDDNPPVSHLPPWLAIEVSSAILGRKTP